MEMIGVVGEQRFWYEVVRLETKWNKQKVNIDQHGKLVTSLILVTLRFYFSLMNDEY